MNGPARLLHARLPNEAPRRDRRARPRGGGLSRGHEGGALRSSARSARCAGRRRRADDRDRRRARSGPDGARPGEDYVGGRGARRVGPALDSRRGLLELGTGDRGRDAPRRAGAGPLVPASTILDAFARRPAREPRRRLNLTIAVAHVTLEPVGPGGFRAVTRLKVLDRAGSEEGISVSRSTAAAYRSLVFHQGAFGFAPKLYIVKDGRTLLDTFVPFRTVREGPDGASFLGDFEITGGRSRCSAAP